MTAIRPTLALMLAAGVGCGGPVRSDEREGRAGSAVIASSVGSPAVVSADHALLDARWRPNGHLLVLTPRELVDIDPDAPDVLPIVPLAPVEGYRLRGASGASRFLLESAATGGDGGGWQVRDSLTLRTVAHGPGRSGVVLSQDGALVAAPETDGAASGYRVIDAETGEPRSTFPGAPGGTFAFLDDPSSEPPRAGVSPVRTAALVEDGELQIVDVLGGAVLLRRRLVRLAEDGSSRELLELRGPRLYLTSTYGFEVVDLPSGRTRVRERDTAPSEAIGDAHFTISDDGRTVTESSTFAETFVSTWNVPSSVSVARTALATTPTSNVRVSRSGPSSRPTCRLEADGWTIASGGDLCDDGEGNGARGSDRTAPGASPDGRSSPAFVPARSPSSLCGAARACSQLGAAPEPPIDMTRHLDLASGTPRVTGRPPCEIVLSRLVHAPSASFRPPSLPPKGSEAPPEVPALPASRMSFAAEDERAWWFDGIGFDGAVEVGLLPVIRVDRQSGESVPIYVAQCSAVARYPGGGLEVFGDENEIRRSVVCATEQAWLPSARCFEAFAIP